MKQDRAKIHFDKKQQTTIQAAGNTTQKVTVKRSGSLKQDVRPAGPFKTTPKTNNGLGAKGR